jgi:hypothetical protein
VVSSIVFTERNDPKSITNYEYIKSMSIDVMAQFLWEQNGNNRYWKSVENYKEWLRQEHYTE